MYHELTYTQGSKTVKLVPSSGYLLTDIDDLTSQNVSLSTTQNMDGVGVQVNAQSVSAKAISLAGILLGDSAVTRKELLQAFTPMKAGTLSIDGKYHIEVYPTSTPNIDHYGRNPEFSVILNAPRPYFLADDETMIPLRTTEKVFSFPTTLNSFILGQRTAEVYKDIHNPSSVPCGFTVTYSCSGTVTNPKLEDMNTGKYVRVKATMTAGDIIEVEYTGGRINVYRTTSGVRSNAFALLDINSNPFELQPGENLIKISADSGYTYLDAYITYNAAFAGVEE